MINITYDKHVQARYVNNLRSTATALPSALVVQSVFAFSKSTPVCFKEEGRNILNYVSVLALVYLLKG